MADTLPILAGANAIDFRAGTSNPSAQAITAQAHIASTSTRAVLLIHGFGDTPQTLRYLAENLYAQGYDVRVPLLPGHGRTISAFSKVTYQEWIDAALAELMAMRARYPWVALGGLSMGGALASILASDVRDLPALCLIAPYLGMPFHVRFGALAHRVLEFYPGPIGGRAPQSIHDPVERAKNLSYGAVPPHALKQLGQVVTLARRALPHIVAPTLYIQSRHDNRIRPRTAEWAFKRIGAKKKRFLMTEVGGHIITADYGKERVFEEVRAWLRGGPGTNPSMPDTLGGPPHGHHAE